MTIDGAIQEINSLKPNIYSDFQKISWLSDLDGQLFRETLLTHEDSPEEFTGYTESTDRNTELIVKEPYSRLYITWLECRIDYYNAEYGKFNNSNAVFNAELTAWRNWYNRTHMPKGEKGKYW